MIDYSIAPLGWTAVILCQDSLPPSARESTQPTWTAPREHKLTLEQAQEPQLVPLTVYHPRLSCLTPSFSYEGTWNTPEGGPAARHTVLPRDDDGFVFRFRRRKDETQPLHTNCSSSLEDAAHGTA